MAAFLSSCPVTQDTDAALVMWSRFFTGHRNSHSCPLFAIMNSRALQPEKTDFRTLVFSQSSRLIDIVDIKEELPIGRYGRRGWEMTQEASLGVMRKEKGEGRTPSPEELTLL